VDRRGNGGGVAEEHTPVRRHRHVVRKGNRRGAGGAERIGRDLTSPLTLKHPLSARAGGVTVPLESVAWVAASVACRVAGAPGDAGISLETHHRNEFGAPDGPDNLKRGGTGHRVVAL